MEESPKKSLNPVVKGTLQAFADAGSALFKLVKDPIGGQEEALNDLGPKKAFNVSILFMLFFSVAIYLFSYDAIKAAAPRLPNPDGTFSQEFKLSIEQFFRLLLFSLIPFISLFLSIFTSSFFAKIKQEISTSLFVTGLISVPLGVFFFVYNFVAANNVPVGFIISIFTLSFAILLLNASLIEIYKFSSRLTMVLIPSIFTLAGFLSYLLFKYFLLQ